MIYLDLFISFLQIGAFSIGGGYAAIPLIQNQVVDKMGWLDLSSFVDLVTIAEMTPGPIAINSATFVGNQVAGPLGAIVATLGCILPSMIVASIFFYIYYRYKTGTGFQNVLLALRAAVVSLIGAAGLSILSLVVFGGHEISIANIEVVGILIFIAAFLAIRKFKVNPIAVIAGCGGIGVLVYSFI